MIKIYQNKTFTQKPAVAIIGKIVGDFYGNYSVSYGKQGYEVYAGVISNNKGTIGSITGDFVGNYIIKEGGQWAGLRWCDI